MDCLPSTVSDWYELSKDSGTVFFGAHRRLKTEMLANMLTNQTALPPRGRLRTIEEVQQLHRNRKPLPSVQALRARGRADEYALQCMFVHRGFFEHASQLLLCRELPTCCAKEMPEGWVDLLLFDTTVARATLVELKDEDANDPLTGVVLEVLSHWAFHVQHSSEFLDFIEQHDTTKQHEVTHRRDRKQQDEFHRKFGPGYRSDLDLIFANPDGTPLKPD
jgi:hypothetical protein